MNTALVCIAKNEDPYIQEWIEYNFKLGFDYIFIYQNNWRCNIQQNNVVLLTCDGEAMQMPAYNHFIHNYAKNYQWTAFFDIDEFLVLHKHNNIKDFLDDYSDCNVIGINWAVFGNNYHEKVIDNNYNVLSRFTKRSNENFIKNEHVKIIAQLPYYHMFNPHFSSSPYWFSLNKQKCTGPHNKPVDWNVAQLNHYCTKSTEEMHSKISRGRADTTEKRNLEDLLTEANANQVEDFKALEFFLNSAFIK
jgi:hypothetical protein